MEAILIDVKNETVTNVTYDSTKSLQEWYRLIGCEMVEVARELPNDDHTGNTIMVDEEGMLSLDKESKFFTIAGGHQPFAGNGLIVGINYDNGETIDCSITADDVRRKINFFNINQVRPLV